MKRFIMPALRYVDARAAELSLRLRGDRPALLGFMFHSLFADRAEVESGLLDPFQPVTVADLRAFIEIFLEAGYRFVAPADLEAGLMPEGRYALITFDDGYANNLRLLPILQEFDVPATLFVSANHLAEAKGYWWDVHYRESHKRGLPTDQVDAERDRLKELAPAQIDAELAGRFGAEALRPVGDSDRPMTESELKAFAADPRVTIGNHTADHARLTLCSDAEIVSQIRTCQDFLSTVLGITPEIIAYPNGDHDDRVVRIAAENGLRFGVTVEPCKTPLPLVPEQQMTVPRFMPTGGPDLRAQCLSYRSELQLLAALRKVARGARPGV